jgi:hypothetical protein
MFDVAALHAPIEKDLQRNKDVIVLLWSGDFFEYPCHVAVGNIGELTKGHSPQKTLVVPHGATAAALTLRYCPGWLSKAVRI